VTGIAVVIPARDEGAAIGGTLESLAGQALRPDRIVVVVNNSTDATEAVAREFAARPGAPATDVLVMPGRNKFRKAGALNYGIRHLIGWRHLRDGQPLPAETWLTMHHPGDAAEIAEAKADAIAHRIHARADRVEARSMWAVDRAGTVYASMLRRGIDDTPVTQVEYAGPGRTIKGGIPAALERIVSATLAVTMPGGR
jgi:glycosyltransferase involved in cell wall biosynthesis